MFITVYPDTILPIDPDYFRAGGESFTLNEDSTIYNHHGGVTSHYGRFYFSNDTLRLEWERWTNGEFGDGSHSQFSGAKQ